MEDLDALREVPGAADGMLKTLELFGFQWDGPIERQSERLHHYAAALDSLRAAGLLYICGCSRAMLPDDGRYPGTCRHAQLPEAAGALRLMVDSQLVQFEDRVQGPYAEELSSSIGDFIVHRRDHVFAYQLAVVVDDAAQGISDVVRGADLLDNTPRQIYLQRLLRLTQPRYAHVPLLVDEGGGKLSKSRQSLALDACRVIPQLVSVFGLLGLSSKADAFATVDDAWSFAVENFDMDKVPKRPKLPLSA
jgi:glutamyl-Q tRNA(Asp) synthetase